MLFNYIILEVSCFIYRFLFFDIKKYIFDDRLKERNVVILLFL